MDSGKPIRSGNDNIFNLLRLILALMVIITHSYFVLGYEEEDGLYLLSNGQIKFSVLAVNSFLVLSGYLITISFIKSNGVIQYLSKRILRIVPAYWAVVFGSVLILCLFVSKDPELLLKYDTWRYILNNLFFRIHYSIDGVLNGRVINGSLWTIPYEFFLYLLIIPLLAFVRLRLILVAMVFLLFYSLKISYQFIEQTEFSLPLIWLSSKEIFRLGTYFLAGSLLSFINFKSSFLRFILLSLSLGGMVLSILSEVYNITDGIFLPLFIISLGLTPSILLSRLTSKGDFSYGIYLWAFPVQQVLAFYVSFTDPLYLTCATVPVVILIASVSWRYIEEPCLKLKYKQDITTGKVWRVLKF